MQSGVTDIRRNDGHSGLQSGADHGTTCRIDPCQEGCNFRKVAPGFHLTSEESRFRSKGWGCEARESRVELLGLRV